MTNQSGVIALREHLLGGNIISKLEALLLFGVQNLTGEIHRMRKDGFSVKSQRVPMTKILARTNKYAVCQPPTDLPHKAPDGKRFAVIKGVNTCEGPSQTVTFLDAATLQPQGESVDVDLIALVPESAGDPQYTLSFLPKAWLDNDSFMIGFGAFQNDGTQGWVYSPNTEPQWREGVAFDCLYPSTTSSYVDASGRVVYVTDWGTFHHGPEDDDFEETSYGCSE